PRRTGKGDDKLATVLLCGAAVWVTMLVFKIEWWVDFYRIIRVGLARNDVGYTYELIFSGLIALVVLRIPAACIGAVLPLMIRGVGSEGRLLGAKVGGLLTWNAVGCVTGTVVTGFVLMALVRRRDACGVLGLAVGLVPLGIAARSRWFRGAATAMLAC